ncbi:uncharacterized protein LOC128863580 [Anastrepha ludens]|uniref:uncharacterized protein LOC128863580 n=1 Tax=Anastrepha ludens TaxID=28586 RepID=UPI0023B12ED8|nr:uncharacterized protein LOC128863580 [Anastrepha ludens]
MTAFSFKLPLCMLLLTALLHPTATTRERAHQTKDYRVTRRFIEIGSQQPYPEEATKEVPNYRSTEKWRIESAEGANQPSGTSKNEAYKNAEEAQKKERDAESMLKKRENPLRGDTKVSTTTSDTQLSIDVNEGVTANHFFNASSGRNSIQARVAEKKLGLQETFEHQITLDAAAYIKSKIRYKAPLPTTAPPSLLRALNTPTNHINYQPNTEFSQHSQWVAQRFKRQQSALLHKTQQSALHSSLSFSSTNTATHYNPLPAVPLPPPPPFPGNFAISPFSGGAKQSTGGNILNAFAFAGMSSSGSSFSVGSSSVTQRTNSLCGGVLKSRYGNIQTPNFPHKFSTPIECVWVIDASELPITTSAAATATGGGGGGANISIIVYLTQLYVLGGLKFTEYMYYSDDYKVPAHRVFTLTEDDVTQVAWVQFSSQYLEIRFTMSSLDGTHLRALDRLLDVYGFNITYEVQQEVKAYQCNTLQCRFLGHCYAKADYSSYYCSCFPGFSGPDCGRGPLCEDPHTNICQNGGTCKHIGDAAITCHCPSGFKGTKCEIPEINEITRGCTSNTTSSDCHKECDFERASEGVTLRKASKIIARNGKTRYEVTIRLGANLTAFYRNMDPERRPSDHLPSLLERHFRI